MKLKISINTQLLEKEIVRADEKEHDGNSTLNSSEYSETNDTSKLMETYSEVVLEDVDSCDSCKDVV